MKDLKKLFAFVLVLAALLSLCACGSEKNQSGAGSQPAAEMTSALPGADLVSGEDTSKVEAETEEEKISLSGAADKAAASALIGEDINKLYEAIGEPADSAYSPSCMGSGEDGELYYDGFTVYTYREGNSEKIQDVD